MARYFIRFKKGIETYTEALEAVTSVDKDASIEYFSNEYVNVVTVVTKEKEVNEKTMIKLRASLTKEEYKEPLAIAPIDPIIDVDIPDKEEEGGDFMSATGIHGHELWAILERSDITNKITGISMSSSFELDTISCDDLLEMLKDLILQIEEAVSKDKG